MGGDDIYMRGALVMARRGLGRVAPNPSVGCVIVREGVIVARARTGDGGRPHAEERALAAAGSAAYGASVYVTLEPCAHRRSLGMGCAAMLAAAGIGRCVIAQEDPDPRTRGLGAACLRAAGIEVVSGLCSELAASINWAWRVVQERGRPLVTLKLAASLDGRIAYGDRRRRAISGAESWPAAQVVRLRHDAVLVGSGTVLRDDPRLNVRLRGLSAPQVQPLRIILDRRLRLPLDSALVAQGAGTLVIADEERIAACGAQYRARGVSVLAWPRAALAGDQSAGKEKNRRDSSLALLLSELRARGVTRLLVEGGARVAASFLRAGLVDQLEWLRGPLLLGDRALAATAGLRWSALRVQLEKMSCMRLGDDVWERYRLHWI